MRSTTQRPAIRARYISLVATAALASLPANATLTNGTGTFGSHAQKGRQPDYCGNRYANIHLQRDQQHHRREHWLRQPFHTVGAAGNATAGTAIIVTVTALDAFNNTATGYAGTIHFTGSDNAAQLPADSTLTNGVGTLNATFGTGGRRPSRQQIETIRRFRVLAPPSLLPPRLRSPAAQRPPSRWSPWVVLL